MKQLKLLLLIVTLVLFAACGGQDAKKTLPFLGNHVYEANDTIYHSIQDFRLIDQDNAWVTNETFKDKIYVADFFFTSCPTICPIMKQQMLRVYEKIENNDQVGILSHTIDPTYDTPAVLKEFAGKLGVNTKKWRFVTGDSDYIYDLGETSYMVMADEDEDAEGGFIHSGAFLLVDKSRRIRGVYDGTVEEQVNTLIQDIDKLLEEYDQVN